MELPDGNAWIDDSLEEVAVGQHALYAADLPPLGPASAEQQAQVNMFEQSFHQSLGNFGGDAVHHASELQQQQLPPQGPVEQPQWGNRAANERRVHKADREKLRRDRLNEQFSELASALDPDRPKNDKATILSDSVQELNELRTEVKRLKAEHATLLDESRDLSQEKSELREEKALLKSETEQLQAQLQQRLRLALSWPAMDPSLMMSAFPYPVPVPAPPTGPSQPPAPSSSPQVSTQSTSAQVPAPIIPPSPFMPPLPPPGAFAIHPYAAMFANRPSGANLPFFPYYHPPPGLIPGPNSSIERPFAQYPGRNFGVPESEAPFKPAFLAANQATLREENAQSTESTDVCQASGETIQKEGGPSQASRSPAESPEIHKDPPISPAA